MTGDTNGVRGTSISATGTGVYGLSKSSTGFSSGVYGKSNASTGNGVYGEGFIGVKATTVSPSGVGVYARAEAASGSATGVYATTQSTSGKGVHGSAAASTGVTFGVYGVSASITGRGVYGTSSGESAYALYGLATGQYGKGLYAEVTSTHSSANAILAKSGGGSSYAAYLIGRVFVTGTLQVQDVPSGDYAEMQYNTSTGQLYYDTSSRRFKENIEPLDTDFSRILEATPVQYTRQNAPERIEIGYIAEDMEALGLERLIGYDSEGQVETFNYEKMILYVVEVLKEQRREIRDLQNRLQSMESE